MAHPKPTHQGPQYLFASSFEPQNKSLTQFVHIQTNDKYFRSEYVLESLIKLAQSLIVNLVRLLWSFFLVHQPLILPTPLLLFMHTTYTNQPSYILMTCQALTCQNLTYNLTIIFLAKEKMEYLKQQVLWTSQLSLYKLRDIRYLIWFACFLN